MDEITTLVSCSVCKKGFRPRDMVDCLTCEKPLCRDCRILEYADKGAKYYICKECDEGAK